MSLALPFANHDAPDPVLVGFNVAMIIYFLMSLWGRKPMIATVSTGDYEWNCICFAKARVARTRKESHHGKTRIDMNALRGKMEAMVMTKPDRNATNGEKQPNHL